MESEHLKHEQTDSDPASDRSQKTFTPVATSSHWGVALSDARPPAVRLDQPFGPSHGFKPHVLQAKLTIGEAGDEYEQEADRVADRVMRMPDPTLRSQRNSERSGSTALIESWQRASPRLQLHRHATSDAPANSAAPDSVHEVLRSPGQPLNPSIRAFMEPRFGHDFSNVRVHDDERAAKSAREIGAVAFTVGREIVLGSQSASATVPGRHLLAHELAHVVQQRGTVRRWVQRQTVHMETGRFVGQIGGPLNNNRDEVLGAMDRLADMNAYSSNTAYQNERPIVAALPAASPVPPASMPATISAITTNETPTLDTFSARSLGLTLTDTVGRGMVNASNDILPLQDMLHVNWHIDNFNYGVERARIPTTSTTNVPDASIPATIAGITRLKRAYVGGLHTLRFRRQLGVLGTALTSVGSLNWVPFDTGAAVADPSTLQSDFARWALIPGQPQPNSVSGRINCWEMILFSAFRAGFLTLARIRQIYTLAVENVRQGRASRVGETVESELRTGRTVNILDLGNPLSPQPLTGDMVIFNTATNHAAISLGTLTSTGKHEVLSLFNRPNAISQVQRTTIEDLIAANPGASSLPIRFWGVTW